MVKRAYLNKSDSDSDNNSDSGPITQNKNRNSTSSSSNVDKTKSTSTNSLTTSSGTYKNKTRVLVIASRGITARFRHLLEDFKQMIPHHRKDNKLDNKGDIRVVNEIAEMKSCNYCLYLECRKRKDLYMFLSGTPNGPSVKFQVTNIHTMDELKLTGNCMLGSRPLLDFDDKFNSNPHWGLMKELFIHVFGTPKGHPKSKPFVDRVMAFYIIKNNIWIRNYQIIEKYAYEEGTENKNSSKSNKNDMNLVEIGPRFVLIPIRIFGGSLGGATLYQNQSYITPNETRSSVKRDKGNNYKSKKQRVKRAEENTVTLEADPLSKKNVFS